MTRQKVKPVQVKGMEESLGKDSLSLLIPREPVRIILRLLLETLFHIKTKGLKNIPAQGPAIIVCNHTDYLDVFVQFAYSNRKLLFLGKQELLKFKENSQVIPPSPNAKSDSSTKIMGFTLEKLIEFFGTWYEAQMLYWGMEPIERNSQKKKGYKEAYAYYQKVKEKMLRLLKEKNVLSIFPEGTRTKTGVMGTFKLFVATLAIEARVPIVPSSIIGAWKFSTLESFLSGRIFRTRIQYNVGKPIFPKEFPKGGDLKRRAKLLSLQLEKEVYALNQELLKQKDEKGHARTL